ncbi:LysM repeat protein [Rhodoferax ferrireducens]|uniref:LysM repeat protein n=1 Tax=Rhodoferax ferrireducens TaxID=192843 RepID=A0ABU2C6Z6_9BURK|nr:LysM peptidoglycan-binding domain-containing protein [Rhodoferax ferrireducens]MDR7377107.1 LysM repeat protein [Rhodoferax ferrireducens]
MANNPLQPLAEALKAAAPGRPLTRDFIASALGNGVNVPAGLDIDLAQAFQTGGAGGLPISYTAGSVSPVTAVGFTVTPVSLRLINAAVTNAVLTFSLVSGATPTLRLQVVAHPSAWSWSDLSPFTAGWPFLWAELLEVGFTFDTAVGGAIQTLEAHLVPPSQFKDIVALIQGLAFPGRGVNLPIAGKLDFSAMDGGATLYPTGSLTAPLASTGSLTLFSLNVSKPAFTLCFPAADTAPTSETQAGAPPEQSFPNIVFSLDLTVTEASGVTIGYTLSVAVLPDVSQGLQAPAADASDRIQFLFGLQPNPAAGLLSPGGIAALVGGHSYFSDVPAQVQGFLTSVVLRSLMLEGLTNPPSLTGITVSIGANPAMLPWTPFTDPDNQLAPVLTDLDLVWRVSDPLVPSPSRSATFTASGQIMPTVFRGTFHIEIDSDLKFEASYDGPAIQLGTLVDAVSLKRIQLPSGLAASLSNIVFLYDGSSGVYSFAADIDASLSFLTIDGQPLLALQEASISLSATPSHGTPPPPTLYDASFSGVVSIGPAYMLTSVSHQTGDGWSLSTSLTQTLLISDLADQFLSDVGLGPFIPGDMRLTTFALTASIPDDDSDAEKVYNVSGGFIWNVSIGSIACNPAANIVLAFDGSKPSAPVDQRYSRSVVAMIGLFSAQMIISYEFKSGNTQLSVTWEGITATYNTTQADKNSLTFTLTGWSLGSLITALVKTIPELDPYFTLPAPFDLLDDIPLDGLRVTFDLGVDSGLIMAIYPLSSPPLDLGFASISGLRLTRYRANALSKHQLLLQLIGTSFILPAPLIVASAEDSDATGGPPGVAVDQLQTISVPGQGDKYFKLVLFAMGQRVKIVGMEDAPDVTTILANLEKNAVSTDTPTSPVGTSTSPQGTPYYDRSSDWLIAARMLILERTIDLGFVFHDSDLYGLHLKMAGTKAKALAGLAIDILYKKVTDEIGMYQVDWRFPDAVRNLNFGAVSVVLPDIGVQIYTNGDFMIDIGFPYKMDFTRSFSFSVIIAGIPVTGGGGVYFGKLSGATSTVTPVTKLGTFNPVIAVGIGFQIGLGYSFTAGPLSAGFSLTATAIIEGVIAAWHPYALAPPPGPLPPPPTSVQHDYFFKIAGTAGIVGLLYGSVDFAIIKASLSVNITLSITLTYASFQPIEIAAYASVSVSLSVRIDLGLFSITFHFHFQTQANASFSIYVDEGTAPWVWTSGDQKLLQATRAPIMPELRGRGRAKPVVRPPGLDIKLMLYATAAYTVVATEGETDFTQQAGAFVTLLMMDAPSAADNSAMAKVTTSFEKLCRDMLPWLVNQFSIQDATAVSVEELKCYLNLLANLDDPPLDFCDWLTFLSSFKVRLTVLNGPLPGSVPFPVFDGLTATVQVDASAATQIDFSQWVMVTPEYRKGISALFTTLGASLQQAGASPPAPPRPGEPLTTESMSAMLFVDAMMLIGRQLLQAAIDAFAHYQYALENGNTIAAILVWCETHGTPIDSDDVVLPNGAKPLLAGSRFVLAAPAYTILNGDTLQSIAAGFKSDGQITAASLIDGNLNARIVAAGTVIPIHDGSYSTPAGISFIDLMAKLDQSDWTAPVWTSARLAAAIGSQACLVSGVALALPETIDTIAGDTLAGLAARYGVTVSSLGANSTNQAATLFDTNRVSAISLTGITKAPLAHLWAQIVADDQLAQAAGMLSRFLAAGLRLPVSTPVGGLTLSADFTELNAAQDRYGLYQLTGQQFPAVPSSPAPTAYELVMSADATLLARKFLTFDDTGSNNSTIPLLTPLLDHLAPLLTYARRGAFNPVTTFRILPAVARTPQLSALTAGVGFVSANPAEIAAITLQQPGTARALPMLWMVPASLLAEVAARQTTFDAAAMALPTQLAYLPLLQPVALITDPISKVLVQTGLDGYAWATRVEFSVKRLPPAPAGSPTTKTRSYTYELLALNAASASLLERLVSALAGPISGQAISGLFLAYPQGSGASRQLLAPSDSTSPAFFTRTNLSTQRNPGEISNVATALAARPPVGNVANPPAQVVRLLWELSTVRSGGYFLSYDLLPELAFDSTGKADLCILVTYPRGGALTLDRLTGFVNALLTDDANAGPGIQVALAARSAAVAAQPATDASLADLASLYGLSIGRVAELNAGFPLVPGVTLAIDGVTHLTAAAGTADYVPPSDYVTAAGDTLQSVAAGFGLDVDDLAIGAAAAPIFTFPSAIDSAAVLMIDPQGLDVHPSDASGNITIELSRPPAPYISDISDPVASTLEQLYSMLAAGVQKNQFFGGSAGPPVGPQHHDDSMNPGTVGLAAARRQAQRDPVRRRQALAGLLGEPLCYRQVLGLTKVATSNTAPAGGSAGIPPGSANPYIGVGSLAQLDLEWRDLFGNILVDQFRSPPPGYSGPATGQIVPLLYRDKLIGPAAWPNLLIHYLYRNDEKSGWLDIALALSTTIYDDVTLVRRTINGVAQQIPAGQAAAIADYPVYCRIWYQLNQDYSAAGIPWASGQAVQFTLHNSLLAEPDLALSDSQAQPFRHFVAKALGYLDLRRQGQFPAVPALPLLAIPIDVASGIAAGNILPLALTLTLSRPGLLVDSALAGLAGGETSSVDLLPMPDPLDTSGSGYSNFAKLFEAMFVSNTGGWTMRLGTSAATAGAAGIGDKRRQSLWAVRFAASQLPASPQGLGFVLSDLPLYYAPRPLARSLVSANIELYASYDGTCYPPACATVSQHFTGVDPNVWFQSVLDAIDTALAPDLAAALYLYDLSTGVADPLSDAGTLGQLLAIKKALAETIAETVEAIIEPSPKPAPVGTAPAAGGWPKPDDDSAIAAGNTLRQALLNQLGPAFSTTAIAVFQASKVSGNAVKLFGKPRAALAGGGNAGDNATFSVSSGRLPLDPAHPARLAFLLDSKTQVSGASYLPLKLTWDITHVEHNIRSIPGIDDYTDSDWIGFIQPPSVALPDPLLSVPFNNGDTIYAPVLLRALPQPPTMRGQSATATHPMTSVPAELAQWNYQVDFTYGLAAQDTIATEIDLNVPGGTINAPGGPEDPTATALYQALAQFVQVYPAVSVAMAAALKAVTGTGTVADKAAAVPVQWFLQTLAGVKTAYYDWVHPPENLSLATVKQPEVRIAFQIKLVPDAPNANATVAINELKINHQSATFDAGSMTITGSGVTLPLPFVQLLPDQWRPVVSAGIGADSVRFNYQGILPSGEGPTPLMTHQEAVKIPSRSITMTALNIFGYRNGNATLWIRRNLLLLPDAAPPAATNEAFIFSTPAVQFTSPIAASLAFNTPFSIDTLKAKGPSYQEYLDAFFTGLGFGTTGKTDVEVAATVTYSYHLNPGQKLPRTVVPVTLLLHTPAAISATTAPSFVKPLAAMTDGWRSKAVPTTDGGATIDMALTIYPAGHGNLQPMLQIEKFTVTATMVPLP